MTPEVDEKFFGTRYLAEVFDVTEWTVREWLKAGKIKGIKIGQHWKVSETNLRNYLREKHG